MFFIRHSGPHPLCRIIAIGKTLDAVRVIIRRCGPVYTVRRKKQFTIHSGRREYGIKYTQRQDAGQSCTHTYRHADMQTCRHADINRRLPPIVPLLIILIQSTINNKVTTTIMKRSDHWHRIKHRHSRIAQTQQNSTGTAE